MSSQALKDIAEISFDDPQYQEASRHELAMKLLAADNDIKGLNDKLEALTKQLESSTKKAIKFKTKYQNSQCAVGDIFESLKKVIVNFTDQKRTFCTSKLHTFFIALTYDEAASAPDNKPQNLGQIRHFCTDLKTGARGRTKPVQPSITSSIRARAPRFIFFYF